MENGPKINASQLEQHSGDMDHPFDMDMMLASSQEPPPFSLEASDGKTTLKPHEGDITPVPDGDTDMSSFLPSPVKASNSKGGPATNNLVKTMGPRIFSLLTGDDHLERTGTSPEIDTPPRLANLHTNGLDLPHHPIAIGPRAVLAS